jgi:hypothetical protein
VLRQYECILINLTNCIRTCIVLLLQFNVTPYQCAWRSKLSHGLELVIDGYHIFEKGAKVSSRYFALRREVALTALGTYKHDKCENVSCARLKVQRRHCS